MKNGLEDNRTAKDFTIEYYQMMNLSKNSVVIETQWKKEGDLFQKFSMYDDSYVSVGALGSTTLIKKRF